MRYNLHEQNEASTVSSLYVKSVEKAFAVLNAFGDGQRTMSLSEIAKTLNISKSSAQRFTYTLSELGYLSQAPRSRRWSLTPRTLEVGRAYVATDELIQRAMPHLIALNERVGESVNLSRPDGVDMVFVARFTSHQKTFVQMPIGTRIPIFCTASGRAYMAKLDDVDIQAYLRRSELQAFTGHTLTNAVDIIAEIDYCRESGYALASEQFYIGDLSIAAPVIGADGQPQGAVNVSCPTSRWSMDAVEREIAPWLVQTARSISVGPGGRV